MGKVICFNPCQSTYPLQVYPTLMILPSTGNSGLLNEMNMLMEVSPHKNVSTMELGSSSQWLERRLLVVVSWLLVLAMGQW